MAKSTKSENTEKTIDLSAKVKPLHTAHSEYLKAKFGIDVPPEHVFAIYSTRVDFRKNSDNYQGAKSAAAEAKEAAAKAKEEAKAAKAEERAKAKAEKEAEAAKKAEAEAKDEKKPAAKTAKPAAKKAAPAKGGKKPF
jgi:hypothetical protein